jgi:hypothetical protein
MPAAFAAPSTADPNPPLALQQVKLIEHASKGRHNSGCASHQTQTIWSEHPHPSRADPPDTLEHGLVGPAAFAQFSEPSREGDRDAHIRAYAHGEGFRDLCGGHRHDGQVDVIVGLERRLGGETLHDLGRPCHGNDVSGVPERGEVPHRLAGEFVRVARRTDDGDPPRRRYRGESLGGQHSVVLSRQETASVYCRILHSNQ